MRTGDIAHLSTRVSDMEAEFEAFMSEARNRGLTERVFISIEGRDVERNTQFGRGLFALLDDDEYENLDQGDPREFMYFDILAKPEAASRIRAFAAHAQGKLE